MDSEELKKIWEVELDLLEKIKQICNKYKLTYFANFGTLIGAARHKGFIPWDDDIDIFLKWPDYKKLMEVAPNECEYPYFFQSFLTESDGEASSCRLRRSDTTGFTKWELENSEAEHNKGIFIDIFPLFYIPESEKEREIQKESIMFFWKCIRGHNAISKIRRNEEPCEEYKQYIPYYMSVCQTMSIVDIKWAYLGACAMVESPTSKMGATSYRVHKASQMWDSSLFDSFVEMPFENTTINCPADYDTVLNTTYTNWRVPSSDGACHEMVVADANTPWREYIKNIGSAQNS